VNDHWSAGTLPIEAAVRLMAPRLRYPRARVLWSAAGAAAGVEMLAVKEKEDGAQA
jgi:hypothetical protein